MTAPAKFLFDLDFGIDRRKASASPVSASAFETAVAEAEARGYRAGQAAARVEAGTEAERRVAIAMERIADGIARLVQGMGVIEGRLEAEAVEVAMAVATKLAPELIAREPFAELSALATDCFNQLGSVPHVVVRVADALHDGAKERLERIARGQGFEGRVVVLVDPDFAAGDCRIEWADGGMSRDCARTEAVIADAVGRYVAARRADAQTFASGGFADE